VRQIVSTAAVIGAVLGVASCSAGTGHAGHVATVSSGRAGGSFPRECGFGGWPSTASQEGGFADARYAWAARHEWPGRSVMLAAPGRGLSGLWPSLTCESRLSTTA